MTLVHLGGNGGTDARSMSSGGGNGGNAKAVVPIDSSHGAAPQRELFDLEPHHNFAIVFANTVPAQVSGISIKDIKAVQEQVLRYLYIAGIEFILLTQPSDLDHKQLVAVLSDLDPQELEREDKRMRFEEYLTLGHAHRVSKMTPAMKLQLLHLLVQRVFERVQEEFHISCETDLDVDADRNKPQLKWTDIVQASGPLHDEKFNSIFIKGFFQGHHSWRSLFSWDVKADEAVRRVSMKVQGSESDVAVSSGTTFAEQRLIDEERKFRDEHTLLDSIRAHFGERVGFYFVFFSTYTKWQVPLLLVMLLYYLIVRFIDWGAYSRGLSVLGFCVPVVWAPLFLKSLRRHIAYYRVKWELLGTTEQDIPNPHSPTFKWVLNHLTGQLQKVYDPHNWRTKLAILLPFFKVINILIMCVALLPFVQWYVYAKLLPTCECCEWYLSVGQANATSLAHTAPSACSTFVSTLSSSLFVPPTSCTYFSNCFTAAGGKIGSDRWVYILIQGIILGIAIDVLQFELFVAMTTKFAVLESWPVEAQYEREVTRKQFTFMWLNMYFWFWFMSFVYVPFGDRIQQLLLNSSLAWSVPSWGWRDGVINTDEAFVTPLVATAAINLVLDTLLPWLGSCCARSMAVRQRNMRAQFVKLHDNVNFSSAGISKALSASTTAALWRIKKHQSTEQPHTGQAQGQADTSAAPGPSKPFSRPAPNMQATVDEAKTETTRDQVVHMDELEATEEKPRRNIGQLLVRNYGQQDETRMWDETQLHTPESLQCALAIRPSAHQIDVPLLQQTPDHNHYDSAAIVFQFERSEFDPRKDYLDMMMQYGYVNMFTVAWALMPCPAIVNNVLEMRADVLKIMTGCRRPVPFRDSGIGEFINVIERIIYMSIPIVVGLIVMGTGMLEYWVAPTCITKDRAATNPELMSPDFNCIDSWGYRLLAALVLYLVANNIVKELLERIPDADQPTLRRMDAFEHRQRKELQRLVLPQLPPPVHAALRAVFEYFARGSEVHNVEELPQSACLQLFSALHHEAMSTNAKLPPPTMKQMSAFIGLVDIDRSKSVTFSEMVLAVGRTSEDPLLASSIGFQLNDPIIRLADRIRAGEDISVMHIE